MLNKAGVSRVANILKNSKNFFFATSDGKRPFVRPFNAVVEFDDKVYFYTNNRTHAFKQIEINPFIEVCAMIGEGDTWLEQVYYNHFSKEPRNRAQIQEYFENEFKENSGLAQQYLFYYEREKTSK